MNFQHQWRSCRWAVIGAALAISNLAAAAPTCAAPWGEPVSMLTERGTVDGHDLAVDQRGVVTVVWSSRLKDDPGYEVLQARQRNAKGVWQAVQELHRVPFVDQRSSPADVKLGVSPSGHATVLWVKAAPYIAAAVTFDPVLGWGTPQSLLTDDMVEPHAWASVVNSTGQALVAWRDRAHIFHRRFDPARGWDALGSFDTRKRMSGYAKLSAALNDVGQAALAWDDGAPAVSVFQPEQGWSEPERFPLKGETMNYGLALAMGQRGEVFVSWGTASDKPRTQPKKWKVYVNRLDPELGWGGVELLSDPTRYADEPALATASGRVVVVYLSASPSDKRRLKMRRYEPGVGWLAQQDLTAPAPAGRTLTWGPSPRVQLFPQGGIITTAISEYPAKPTTTEYEADLIQGDWNGTPSRSTLARVALKDPFAEFGLASTRVQALAQKLNRPRARLQVQVRDCTEPSPQ